MKSIDKKWDEIIEDLQWQNTDASFSTGVACDSLAFYDLLTGLDANAKADKLAELLREKLRNYEIDFCAGAGKRRYFYWLNNFDTYNFDDIGILMSERIVFELLKTYTKYHNYEKIKEYDKRLLEVFRLNPVTFGSFRKSIYKYRSVKVKGKLILPWQYEGVLELDRTYLS